MRVLVIGGGGREHALCHGLARDAGVERIVCAPGNPGIAEIAETVPLTSPLDVARATRPGLVVIGPEAPLVAGAADELRAEGFVVFGPSGAAARIEGSKAFAKELMAEAGVPTAGYRRCRSESDVAAALEEFGAPYVVKHDELAAGKGVVVTSSRDDALAHARGHEVVVEEYLDGPEVSLFCVTDGATVLPLLPTQDFKRVGDDDTGPNTGGMGAYAPLPWLPAALVDEVVKTVVQPTVDELARRGTPFAGLLYTGLALTARGPMVVEFNCRFGDPEAQVVLPLLRTPLGGLLHAAATGNLAGHPPLDWADAAAVTVVVAGEGYPASPRTGDLVEGTDDAAQLAGVTVFHAGTARDDAGRLVTAGGRVLAVTAVGADLDAARRTAYDAVARIRIRGAHHRRDIAARAARGDVAVPRA